MKWKNKYYELKISSERELREQYNRLTKEALAAALISVKEENRKTETAAEKRFELLNELRSGVATKDQLQALEKVVDDLKMSRASGEGKSEGYAKFLGWILAGIVIVAFLIQNLKPK